MIGLPVMTTVSYKSVLGIFINKESEGVLLFITRSQRIKNQLVIDPKKKNYERKLQEEFLPVRHPCVCMT